MMSTYVLQGYNRDEFLNGNYLRSYNVNPAQLPNNVPTGQRSIHESVARRQFSYVGNYPLGNAKDFERIRNDKRGPMKKLVDAGLLPGGPDPGGTYTHNIDANQPGERI